MSIILILIQIKILIRLSFVLNNLNKLLILLIRVIPNLKGLLACRRISCLVLLSMRAKLNSRKICRRLRKFKHLNLFINVFLSRAYQRLISLVCCLIILKSQLILKQYYHFAILMNFYVLKNHPVQAHFLHLRLLISQKLNNFL